MKPKKGAVTLALSLILAAQAWASLPEPVRGFVAAHGGRYGLEASADGRLSYLRSEPGSSAAQAVPLSEPVEARLVRFLARLPQGNPDEAMAGALRAYLRGRGGSELERRLFEPGGKALTAAGRKALMDILTAEDGLLFQSSPSSAPPAQASGSMTGAARVRAGGSPGALFDRSAGSRGALLQVGGYDWKGFASASGSDRSSLLQGMSTDGSRGTVRVMVSARSRVSADRVTISGRAEASQVLRETGLDESLLRAHGAEAVRAIDNLVMLDVPVDQAGALGQALAARGLESRPARVVRMAASALRSGPSWPDPLFATLPLTPSAPGLPVVRLPLVEGSTRRIPEPGAAWPARAPPGPEALGAPAGTLNAGGRDLLRVQSLHERGMTGRGTTVGIIDSGLDLSHPDFQGRVSAYIDLSGDGLGDPVAHGTHVAGSVGGSGAASNGLFKGMAPETRFVVVKVFGRTGSTSEDTILAAMAAVRNLPEEVRPQVVNMSLGGPGDPETDPINVMANEMMLRDNILMAVAAGNSGPSGETVSSPGNARYVMTVTGVDHEKRFSFFPSRGPVRSGEGGWNKPDLSTVAGNVNVSKRREAFWRRVKSPFRSSEELGLFRALSAGGEPADPDCVYGPGVISARSKDDDDTDCVVQGHPQYRFMSGTSMATPMAAGIGADVVGYLREREHGYQAAEVKAVMMETAEDLGQDPSVQGAGLVDGTALAGAVEERVRLGLPVGNLAYLVAQRGASRWEEFNLKQDGRYERTALGLMDRRTGHLVRSDREYEQVVRGTRERYRGLPWYSKAWRRVKYWVSG